MIKKIDSKPVFGPKALEMVMRDVLGGLEDFAIMNSYESGEVMEVVAIEPPARPPGAGDPHPQVPRPGNRPGARGRYAGDEIVLIEEYLRRKAG